MDCEYHSIMYNSVCWLLGGIRQLFDQQGESEYWMCKMKRVLIAWRIKILCSSMLCAKWTIISYCKAIIFWGIKLSRIHRKWFMNCWNQSYRWRGMPQISWRTFADGSQASKFVKVFSLQSFPLYGIELVGGPELETTLNSKIVSYSGW